MLRRPRGGLRTSGTPSPCAHAGPPRLGAALRRGPGRAAWAIRGACANNLRDVDVDIPQGVLVAVTGVAGSRQEQPVHEVFLPEHPDTVVIDQAPIGRTSRSNPAPTSGLRPDPGAVRQGDRGPGVAVQLQLEPAPARDVRAPGRSRVEMSFLDEVDIPCEDCDGRRYRDEVLGRRLRGKSIADVLDLTARGRWTCSAKDRGPPMRLDVLLPVGLGVHHARPAAVEPVRRRGPAAQDRTSSSGTAAGCTCSTSRRPGLLPCDIDASSASWIAARG